MMVVALTDDGGIVEEDELPRPCCCCPGYNGEQFSRGVAVQETKVFPSSIITFTFISLLI